MTTRVGKILNATIAYSPSSVPAQQTALLLLDYQGLVVSHVGDAGAKTIKAARKMREWATVNHVSVIHCIVDTKDTPAVSSRISARWPNYEAMLEQHPELGLEVPEIVTSPTETLFKRQPGVVSALASYGIANTLQEKDIKSLVLCGLSTSGCVLSTARAATDQEFIVTVVEDACCDPVPEVHDILVKLVLPATAHVASSKDVMGMCVDPSGATAAV